MTSAPANLLAVRRLLLEHLDIHENSAAYPTDLDPAEVGIVGNAAHRGGYHCGKDRVVRNDYSVVESSRDRVGLSDYASALDVGLFTHGKYDLPHFSRWMVRECTDKMPGTADIREIIYSPDGKTVRRWDRLGRRSSGDSSHLFHTHISFFRDATKAGRDLTPVFRRYLTAIGLIAAPPPVEDDVNLNDPLPGTDRAGRTVGEVLADLENLRNYLLTAPGKYTAQGAPAATSLLAQLSALPGQVKALQGDLAAIRALLEQRPQA